SSDVCSSDLVGLDQVLHAAERIVAAHVVAQDRPAVPRQVLLQPGQFGGEIPRISALHDEHHLAAAVHQWQVDRALEVTVAIVSPGILDHGKFVSDANGYAAIHKTGGTTRQGRPAAPGTCPGRFAINGV